jgi:RNA polymerase sigma-70 factor, ECF subfamily
MQVTDEEFAQLYTDHKTKVMALIRSVLRYRQDLDADDICQEVFLKAYTGIKNFKGDASFKTWIRRIALNTCLGALRKGYRDTSLDGMDFPMTDANLRSSDARKDLEVLLSTLSPRRREAIELHHIQGLTPDELAIRLGVSKAAAKSVIWMGKQKMKEHANNVL